MHGHLDHLLDSYGPALVFAVVTLEATGLPLPGESMVIGSAIYCATTHRIPIATILVAASLGAVVGDNLGYVLGRSLGARARAPYGRPVGRAGDRLQLGRHLFRRFGAAVVFVGRFVALLRTFAALLAGANRMPWGRFLFWNALGGVTWACGYGLAAYSAGRMIGRIEGPVAIVLACLAVPAAVGAIWFLRKNEHRLVEQARRDA